MKTISKFVIAIIGCLMVCGCSTVEIPAKSHQLILRVDPTLLQPPKQLLTIDQYKKTVEPTYAIGSDK